MRTKHIPNETQITTNQTYEGETIEQKIERITTNKEPIKDGAPLIYTERKNGVEPQYDIRTDRWEIAIDAMDKVTKTHQAKREESIRQREEAKVVNINPGTGANTSETNP